MTRSLQSEMLARVEEDPMRPCLAFYRAGCQITWRSRDEVYRRALAMARRTLVAGVNPGDVCVIVLPSGEEAAYALLAVLLRGAVPLLIAPPTLLGANKELQETVRTTLRRTRARVAICAPSLAPDVPQLREGHTATRFVIVSDVDEVGSGGICRSVLPKVNDIAAMQLTSGTTSAPRICVWTQERMLAALDGMAAGMALSSDDVCLNWTPLYHDMGLVNNFILCLVRGVPLTMLSPQEFIRRPAIWLRALAAANATTTWSPNFGFAVTAKRAKDEELEGVRLDRVRAFWNAAERIHLETLEAFHERFAALGVRWDALKTNYGCAENVGGATFSAPYGAVRHERVDRELMDTKGVARPVSDKSVASVSVVSAGRPHPHLRVLILSHRGRALPDGRVGEICLSSPSRMLRYHCDPRETARAIRSGLLHTADLGYTRDGELFWVGRLRERIAVHGKKLDPSAFEAILASTPAVREGCFAAFGVPDPRAGTELVVLVTEVRLPLAESPDQIISRIRRECFVRLGVTPEDVVLVPPGTLAKTSSGKRRHRHFRNLYIAGGLEQHRLAPGHAGRQRISWRYRPPQRPAARGRSAPGVSRAD